MVVVVVVMVEQRSLTWTWMAALSCVQCLPVMLAEERTNLSMCLTKVTKSDEAMSSTRPAWMSTRRGLNVLVEGVA